MFLFYLPAGVEQMDTGVYYSHVDLILHILVSIFIKSVLVTSRNIFWEKNCFIVTLLSWMNMYHIASC